MTEPIKWENGVMSFPVTDGFVEALNKAGEDGWEPWAILGNDGTKVQIAMKRYKRKISLSTDIQGALKS